VFSQKDAQKGDPIDFDRINGCTRKATGCRRADSLLDFRYPSLHDRTEPLLDFPFASLHGRQTMVKSVLAEDPNKVFPIDDHKPDVFKCDAYLSDNSSHRPSFAGSQRSSFACSQCSRLLSSWRSSSSGWLSSSTAKWLVMNVEVATLGNVVEGLVDSSSSSTSASGEPNVKEITTRRNQRIVKETVGDVSAEGPIESCSVLKGNLDFLLGVERIDKHSVKRRRLLFCG